MSNDLHGTSIISRVVPTAVIVPYLSGLEAVLHEIERAQAKRLTRVEARLDYMASTRPLTDPAGGVRGPCTFDLRFGTGQHGEPILDPSFAGLDFSLGHEGNRPAHHG